MCSRMSLLIGGQCFRVRAFSTLFRVCVGGVLVEGDERIKGHLASLSCTSA